MERDIMKIGGRENFIGIHIKQIMWRGISCRARNRRFLAYFITYVIDMKIRIWCIV
jgi:hypothetical protein